MPKPPDSTRLPADPLANTDRILIDGTNLLHALRRGTTPMPAAALIGTLRATVPPNIGIELVLDGPPDRGMHNTRVASGLLVRYSGRRTADHVLLALVEEAGQAVGGTRTERRASLEHILVVTDDRDLRNQLQLRGARSAGTRWLLGRLERRRNESPATGNRRSPAPPPRDEAKDEDAPRWSPGRGATVKKGNPRRGRPRTG